MLEIKYNLSKYNLIKANIYTKYRPFAREMQPALAYLFSQPKYLIPETSNWFCAYPNNKELDAWTYGSLFDGTVTPAPVYGNGKESPPTEYRLFGYWNETLINDLENPPEELESLVTNIRIERI